MFAQSGVDHHSIFQYTYPDNVQLMPKVPACSMPQGDPWNSGHASKFEEAQSNISTMRFAAGRIFVPSFAASLFAAAYSNPGVMELVEALAMPSQRKQETYPFILPALERVAVSWIGKSYRDLVAVMLATGMGVEVQEPGSPVQTTHCLPLGLYRKVTEVTEESTVGCQDGPQATNSDYMQGLPAPLGTAHQGMRFVFANPHSDPATDGMSYGWGETLLPGDQVYVLAPAGWAHRVSLRSHVAEMDNSDRDIFVDGCQVPTDRKAPHGAGYPNCEDVRGYSKCVD